MHATAYVFLEWYAYLPITSEIPNQPPLLLYWTSLIITASLMLFTLRVNDRGLHSQSLTSRITYFIAHPIIILLTAFTLLHATAYVSLEWHAYLRTTSEPMRPPTQ